MEELQRLRDIRRLKGGLEELAQAEAIIKHLREIEDPGVAAKAGFSLRDITLARWNHDGRNWVKPLRIGLVSNFVCSEVENMLRFHLLRERICPGFYVGDFDQVVFELMNQDGGLASFQPDLTLCLLDEHVITDKLGDDWLLPELEAALQESASSLGELFARYAERSRGMLVLNTVVLSARVSHSLLDYRSKARLARAWREFNMRLLDLAASHKNILVLDTELMLQKPGVRLREARMASFAKMYFDDSLLAEVAMEVRKIAQAMTGKTYKCLVLDCDNTLWGGVIGDDGLEGIVLGDSPEGEAFVAFHHAIRRLGKQGIILAVNSKNDKINTDKVFDSHPDCALKQSDFVVQMVNWEPKHQNLKEIASRINIGLDHLVFIDDSSFECNLIKGMMPEVKVIQVGSDAAEFIDTLLEDGWFNTLELTNEDFQRVGQYKSDVAREQLRASYDSYQDYLQELAITVQLFAPDELSLPRVAQLTQRTNQFNLTTRRLSEQDVQQMMDSPDWRVIGIRSSDRFGDNGIIGAIFVEIVNNHTAVVRNFLLSCRVFSRGIENCALREVLLWAKRRGLSEVQGEFIASAKNGKYVAFFPENGFTTLPASTELAVFSHDLQSMAQPSSWIALDSPFLEADCVPL